MTLTLTYRGETTLPVEVEGLTPDWVAGKSQSEIARFEIFHGNQRLPLAEIFRITGETDDAHLIFEGNLAGVHWIGAHGAGGRIDVHGPVGRHLGSDLRGGEIHVHGDAGGWAGAEMRGGLIHIHGNAGNSTGAAYRGSPRGMTGGTLLIDGNAGDELGWLIRRGLIAVGGSAGEFPAFNMIAGTVLIFGNCGSRPGAGMRRGTLGLFGADAPELLPSFHFAVTDRPAVMSVVFRELQSRGFQVPTAVIGGEFDFYRGDLVSVGRGEIVVPHGSAAKMASST